MNTLTYLISITSLIKALFGKKYLSFLFIQHSLLLQMICDRSRVTSLRLSKYYAIMEVEKAFICLAQCYLDLYLDPKSMIPLSFQYFHFYILNVFQVTKLVSVIAWFKPS